MATPREQFGKAVVAAGLLSVADLQAFWNALPPDKRPPHGEAFAAALVKAGKLTPFQAAEVLAGRGRMLVLGDYVLVDRLGAGGMGEVFQARHRHMDRLVALKVVSPQAMKDEEAVRRFQREVKAAARLEHPNIVTAFDSRHDRGVHYLVMQYVEGSDLAGLVKQQGPLKVDLAVQCVLQAARGLAYAHGEGIIHRDIKPANLLLDKKGVIKILDMGLARLEDASNEGLTGTEQVMGTVDYMSPEQAASTHAVDARADIYSLGCTLWFLLMGRKVYEGDTLMSRMLKHREAPIPSLCTARDDVPYDLELIFQKMVAKRPEERYQSMDDVVQDLENLQANTSGLSRLAAGDDSSLHAYQEFLKSMENEGTSIRKDAPTRTSVSSPTGDAPTVEFRDGAIETDPNSDISVAPLAKPKKSAVQRKTPNAQLFIATGIAGVLAVLVAVVAVIMMNRGEADLARRDAVSEETADKDKKPPRPKKGRVGPAPAVAPFDREMARVYQLSWANHLNVPFKQKNSIGMTLVLIPPGEFLMGSSPEQIAAANKMADDLQLKPDHWARGSLKHELPQHRVTITKPYLLGMTEVTVGQFRKFVEAAGYVTEAENLGFGNSWLTKADDTVTAEMKSLTWRTPGYVASDEHPVTEVTWNDAVEFCNWLSDEEKLKPCYRQDAKEGRIWSAWGDGYRLPTEAEWEYACRAGTTTQFSFGDDPNMLEIYGWVTIGGLQSVRKKLANPFGIVDMHGNAGEWCQDNFVPDYYSKSPPPSDPLGPPSGANRCVRRGLVQNPIATRSAYRTYGGREDRSHVVGFRVVRVSVSGGTASGAAPGDPTPSRPKPAADLPKDGSTPSNR